MPLRRKYIWILTYTKKDGTSFDFASNEAMLCVCYINSNIILVIKVFYLVIA